MQSMSAITGNASINDNTHQHRRFEIVSFTQTYNYCFDRQFNIFTEPIVSIKTCQQIFICDRIYTQKRNLPLFYAYFCDSNMWVGLMCFSWSVDGQVLTSFSW